mgnify:CR=1 FL=1|jgi:hypothetical protein
MNISPLTIYLWQLADKIVSASGLFAGMLGLACGFASTIFLLENHNGCKRAQWFLYPAMFFAFSISIFTPSSNTIAMMVVIPEIAHSKAVQQDLPDVYNAAVEAVKSQLKNASK